MRIVAGNHVKLTDCFAAALMRRPQNKIDWRARRGVVHSANNLHVFVLWLGRCYPEQLSQSVLEITDDPVVYEVPKKRRTRRVAA